MQQIGLFLEPQSTCININGSILGKNRPLLVIMSKINFMLTETLKIASCWWIEPYSPLLKFNKNTFFKLFFSGG